MRILIAEDEQRTRQGLVRVLQSLRDEYEIVAQASNGNGNDSGTEAGCGFY